jgi:hypothetical protein
MKKKMKKKRKKKKINLQYDSPLEAREHEIDDIPSGCPRGYRCSLLHSRGGSKI